jgi:hypothetical protein
MSTEECSSSTDARRSGVSPYSNTDEDIDRYIDSFEGLVRELTA